MKKRKPLIPNFRLYKEGEPTVVDLMNSPEGQKICKEMVKASEKELNKLWKEYGKRTIEIMTEICKRNKK